MKIIFIRHGATKGNTEKRYIGTTNENLLQSSIDFIKDNSYPKADLIFSSPMKRCTETAEIIYGNYQIIEDLKEINFGDFENKNYLELKNNPHYQEWINSNGTLPFPNGESTVEFKTRCIKAFETAVKSNNCTLAFVVHGGTIMSILEHFSSEKSTFYQWQIENGNGFTANFHNNKLENIEKIW